MAMQLMWFSRILAGTPFLVAAALLLAPFPAMGQPIIPAALRVADSARGDLFRNVAFIDFDAQGTRTGFECTSRPRVAGRMIDQNVLPVGRNSDPEGAPRPKSSPSTIMHWVVRDLDVPVHLDLPCIEYGSPNLIAVVRSKNAHSKRLEMGAYDDALDTIYLPEGWSGKTPAEISILVHQMAYHVQNLAGLKYECSWERERLAFSAQEKWRRLHESNLWQSFEIDPTIFLLSAEYIC